LLRCSAEADFSSDVDDAPFEFEAPSVEEPEPPTTLPGASPIATEDAEPGAELEASQASVRSEILDMGGDVSHFYIVADDCDEIEIPIYIANLGPGGSYRLELTFETFKEAGGEPDPTPLNITWIGQLESYGRSFPVLEIPPDRAPVGDCILTEADVWNA
jgi:hypothetical protein